MSTENENMKWTVEDEAARVAAAYAHRTEVPPTRSLPRSTATR